MLKRCLVVSLSLFLFTSLAFAQDTPPDQMKKMYDDAMVALKKAQDKTSALAADNDKLTAHVNELEKQLQATRSTAEKLQQNVDSFGEKTYQLRALQAALESFLKANPEIRGQWEFFLQSAIPPFTTSAPAPIVLPPR